MNNIKIIILIFLVFIIVMTLAIDKTYTRKLTELRNELEKDVEAEQLTEKERDMLNKVILWSRIKYIACILLFIGFIVYAFY